MGTPASGGDALGGGGNLIQALLALLLSDKIGVDVGTATLARNPAAQIYRDEIEARLKPRAA